MTLTLDILLSGLILGGMYALIAMGLTLQYGVARIMNLSHGEFLVAAAFGAYWVFIGLAMSPLIGLIVIVPLAFVLNWPIYQIVLMPLVRRAKNRDMLEVDSILATFGLLFVVQGVMLVLFGGQYHTYSYLSIPVNVLGVTVSLNRLLAFVFAVGHRACALSRADAHPHRHRDPRRRGQSGLGAARRRSTCAPRRPSHSRSAARSWRPAACWCRCS